LFGEFPQRKKKKQKERKIRKGRSVETAAAVEIGIGGFATFFLMIPTSCLDKPSDKTLLGLSTVTTDPTAINLIHDHLI
jgi:hypothetical protein